MFKRFEDQSDFIFLNVTFRWKEQLNAFNLLSFFIVLEPKLE